MAAQKALQALWRWVYSYILAQLFLIVIGVVSAALPFFPKEIIPDTVTIGIVVIPLRMFVVNVLIPGAIRWLDKYKFEKESADPTKYVEVSKRGLPGFQLLG